jgi:leucyl-tRNA synthetase
MPQPYEPAAVESKWQAIWTRDGLYRLRDDDPRPKWYDLVMYPYPSGDLHIGHWYQYAPYDTHVRFMRMRGYNVFAPMGYDAFGLPAENAAIRHGAHPYTWTMDNISRMGDQFRSMGPGFNWEQQIICCQPDYYRWNQWFFLQFYKKGLAYRAKAEANWCPSCNTVLANEQVVGGACERCDTTVERRELEQWFFRITQYAEELLDFSGLLEWPEKIKAMQRNWIGRSEGADLEFDISHHGVEDRHIRVFTTRPDTVYGAAFMVLAPEHPLVVKLTAPEREAEVETYVRGARQATEIDRLSTEREKTGVDIGATCVNPFNGERIPIFIADYVLIGYGTGAIMAVPAHDERDFAFAKKYGLPLPVVIQPPDWDGGELEEAYTGPGVMVNSGDFDGTPGDKAIEAVAVEAERRGIGKRTVSYHIRDWLISRQRYWGTPIPIVYCDNCGIQPVPEEELPVLLPEDAEFRPTGESPLRFHEGFLHAKCPKCHGPAQRETDTMDTFVDSSWYFLRFTSPQYTQGPFDPKQVQNWCPVDQYSGGAEHAVMHLLYARFFTKALRDLGLVKFGEPFLRLFNQGLILGEDHEKMSKSRGNVVNPDEFVSRLGADAVRTFLMFIGPWDQGGSWSTAGLQGISRWLNRLWTIGERDASALGNSFDQAAVDELVRVTHKTIRRATNDLDRFQFNTTIAGLMEFSNHLNRVWDAGSVDAASWRSAVESLLVLVAPIAPHIAEELWERAGHEYSIHQRPWPTWDETLVQDREITLVLQVNGKVRDRLTVPSDIAEAQAKEIALANERVRAQTDGKAVRRVIYVPAKLVNVVVD